MGKGLSQAKTLRGRLRVSFGCLICDIQPWTGILSLWAGLQWWTSHSAYVLSHV